MTGIWPNSGRRKWISQRKQNAIVVGAGNSVVHPILDKIYVQIIAFWIVYALADRFIIRLVDEFLGDLFFINLQKPPSISATDQ